MRATAKNVAEAIVAAIPELRAEVDDNEDLYHLTFADLYRWTEESARTGNASRLSRAIQLVDSIFQSCDSDIRNAVAVSFLEYVDPDDPVGRQIFNELTPAFKREWHESDDYVKELVGKSLQGQTARRSVPTKEQ